jgi:tetratricopeptide (TPR) repeat protein
MWLIDAFLRQSTTNQIAIVAVVVAAISGIVVPVVLRSRHKKIEPAPEVGIGRVEGDGIVIGDNANVTVDKRPGADAETWERIIKLAEDKGRAEQKAEYWEQEAEYWRRENAIRGAQRTETLVAGGNRSDAEKALRELRERGDLSSLQELLTKERDKHRDQLIQRNREIAAIAYLRADFDEAAASLDEILKLAPDDIYALNEKGFICGLRGDLSGAEKYFRRVLDLAKELQKGEPLIVALNNLAVIYKVRGNLIPILNEISVSCCDDLEVLGQ